ERALAARMNFRLLEGGRLGISLDETTTAADSAAIWKVFAGAPAAFTVAELDREAAETIPAALARSSAFLTHPVFNRHHSETEMLRYLRALSDKDVALDRSMIPLGSCTMKLNATAEMEPVTWPEFADLHPFAPAGDADGLLDLVHDLERWLADLTGYDAVSLQPNAG